MDPSQSEVNYQALLSQALSEEVTGGPSISVPLHVLASEIAAIQGRLPAGGDLSREHERLAQWAPVYLQLDVALFRASAVMRLPVFLKDEGLREFERARVIRELSALGMFN